MKLTPLMQLHFDLREPFEVGRGPFGRRVVYDVAGGTFQGERLRGTALPSGGDWVLFDDEGVARLDLRVTLKTNDEALIYVHYDGILVPKDKLSEAIEQGRMTDYGDLQFMTRPHFETGDDRYKWLNTVVAVAEGRASATAVEYRVFELGHGRWRGTAPRFFLPGFCGSRVETKLSHVLLGPLYSSLRLQRPAHPLDALRRHGGWAATFTATGWQAPARGAAVSRGARLRTSDGFPQDPPQDLIGTRP